MKEWLLKLLILATSITGCQRSDEAMPSNLLYQRWRISQIQYRTGDPVVVSPNETWAIVTFKANGMILYGEDGRYDPCCSPARFNRKENMLDLVNVSSIPMPERDPNGLCALASCAAYGDAWQISSLSSTQLVINQTYATVTYQPYP